MISSSRAWLGRAAVLLAAASAMTLTACSSGGTSTRAAGPTNPTSGTNSPSSTTPGGATTGSSSSSTPAKPVQYVHIKALNSDGSTYGVGMPVIVYFNHKPSTAKAFQAATHVTVNDKPVQAAWYFEPSDAYKKYPYEAHLRAENYWPAHSKIHVQFPPRGTNLGGDFELDGALQSLSFTTGAAHILLVNNETHEMTVTSDGKLEGTYPVSLGASSTPTYNGTKVIMEQDQTVCMHDTNNTYYECGIMWDQRLTYSGEYLHSAPWNTYNITHGINSSNGCTNLLPADAEKLYHYLDVGDVVKYPNANGPAMTLGAGFGDWNVGWTQWLTGGAVSTT